MSPTCISRDDITDQAIHSEQLSILASSDDSYLRSLFKQYCFFTAHRTTSSLLLGLKQDHVHRDGLYTKPLYQHNSGILQNL